MWLHVQLYQKKKSDSALHCFKTSKYPHEMRLSYSITLNTRIFKVILHWIWSSVFYTPVETGWFDLHVENLQGFYLILQQSIFPVCGWDFQNWWILFLSLIALNHYVFYEFIQLSFEFSWTLSTHSTLEQDAAMLAHIVWAASSFSRF